MKRFLQAIFCLMISTSAFAWNDKPKDPQCDNVAKFAQGIASIKLAGYTVDNINAFVSVPTAQTFPLEIVKEKVFKENLGPEVAYNKFYTECMAVGYQTLYQYYSHEEERLTLQKENGELKNEVEALQTKIDVLQNQVTLDQTALQKDEKKHVYHHYIRRSKVVKKK